MLLRVTVVLAMVLNTVGVSGADDGSAQVYVRAEKAKVLAGSSFGSPSVGEVSRGAGLNLVAKQGAWFRVRLPSGTEGWIQSAFVSETPIVTQAGLAKSEGQDPRSARRRGVRAATMGVRGLTRGAGKLDDAPADQAALQEVESTTVPAAEVQKYESELAKERPAK